MPCMTSWDEINFTERAKRKARVLQIAKYSDRSHLEHYNR